MEKLAHCQRYNTNRLRQQIIPELSNDFVKINGQRLLEKPHATEIGYQSSFRPNPANLF
ncbi:protein of unknown function [Xenorhabdus poinarii G6]|uniref:Uncharacterized protein n=1 Tax=Xenorhabdus poinarii G6 TaxID=1354304 RepID=A0A068R2U6_9GAMM|nr:protein of unknown function [Xenorhabdus poinarii G6]